MTQATKEPDLRKISLHDLESEFDVVAAMQRHIMPNPERLEYRAGFDIYGQTEAARIAGGDYYDFIDLEGRFELPHKTSVVIADASGHGLAAAMLVRDFNSTLYMGISFQTHYVQDITPLLFKKLNRRMYRSSRPNQYISSFYGEMHDNGTLRYVNAGHPPPLLFKEDRMVRLDTGGIVMGVFHKVPLYDIGEEKMLPGDMLVCYTDGITETQNPSGEEYGEGRLIEICQQNRRAKARDLVRMVLEDVDRFRGRGEMTDDRTLVVVRKE